MSEDGFLLHDLRVTVVGLGLMGGSLAGALRGRCREVVGVSRRAATVELALERRLVDAATLDLESGVRGADLVVLATPVRTILSQLPRVAELMPAGGVLMDLGSTKEAVVRAMAALPAHVDPIGGHPMCGKEVSGIEAADVTLYRGATFVLTPLERTSPEGVMRARGLVEAVGARPLVLDPARHDRLVAGTSHLPYLLSVALMAAARELAARDAEFWSLVATGFLGASRLAASDVTMMLDILLTNREAIGEVLHLFGEQFERLARLVAEGDEEVLRSALLSLCELRREIASGRSV